MLKKRAFHLRRTDLCGKQRYDGYQYDPAFLAATEKATQYIINHPVESWEIFAGSAPELNDELNKRAWVDTLPRFALRPTAMDVSRYATFEAFLHDAGLIPSINSISDIAIDVTAQ